MEAPKKWLDTYDVLDENDHPSLEAQAAIHHFQSNLPMNIAEQRAHQDYLNDHARDAAAHHYLGIKAAQAAKNSQAAESHGLAFIQAMQHLGLNPYEPLPDEIKDRLQHQKSYSFKAHKADNFFAPKEDTEEKEVKKSSADMIIDLWKKLI